MGIRRRRSASTTIPGSDAGRLSTRLRGVYVAGGHGMWGLAHGPVTGRLLAEQITTGKQPEALRDFDPLRRTGH